MGNGFTSKLAAFSGRTFRMPDALYRRLMCRVVFSFARAKAMEKFSRYQQGVIKNYYRNREGIAIQRVQELVTELYLAEGKKRKKIWEQLRPHLISIGLTEKQVEHLEKEDKPEMVANLIKEKI